MNRPTLAHLKSKYEKKCNKNNIYIACCSFISMALDINSKLFSIYLYCDVTPKSEAHPRLFLPVSLKTARIR